MNTPDLPNRDDEQLKLLSTFHFILAAVTGLFALIPIIHVVIGATVLWFPSALNEPGGIPPAFGWLFLILGLVFIILGLAIALCMFTTGRFIKQRRNYTFCLIVAGVECMIMPFGTALGVFTFIVLLRDSVKPQFGL